MCADETPKGDEYNCPQCGAKFVVESTADVSPRIEQLLDKFMERCDFALYCQNCEEYVDVQGNVEDPTFRVEGDCPDCTSPFNMQVEVDISDTYLDYFEQGLKSIDYDLYCQTCDEMKSPEQEVIRL